MKARPWAAPAASLSRVVQSSGVRPGPRVPVGIHQFIIHPPSFIYAFAHAVSKENEINK